MKGVKIHGQTRPIHDMGLGYCNRGGWENISYIKVITIFIALHKSPHFKIISEAPPQTEELITNPFLEAKRYWILDTGNLIEQKNPHYILIKFGILHQHPASVCYQHKNLKRKLNTNIKILAYIYA
jgi:hypothetical protein